MFVFNMISKRNIILYLFSIKQINKFRKSFQNLNLLQDIFDFEACV